MYTVNIGFFIYEYQTDDRTAKEFHAYSDNIRKTLKSAVVDLKTKEHLLQETLDNWKVYQNSYEQLKVWLNEGEQILQRSLDEKLVSGDRLFELERKNLSP